MVARTRNHDLCSFLGLHMLMFLANFNTGFIVFDDVGDTVSIGDIAYFFLPISLQVLFLLVKLEVQLKRMLLLSSR